MKKKNIFILLFTISCLFLGVDRVYAESYKCQYAPTREILNSADETEWNDVSTKNTIINVKLEDGELSADCGHDFDYSNKAWYQGMWLWNFGCSIKEYMFFQEAKDMFAKENGVFYCPTTLYLNYAFEDFEENIDYSISTLPSYKVFLGRNGANAWTKLELELYGKSETLKSYIPKMEGDKLLPCEIGGAAAAVNLKNEINAIKTEMASKGDNVTETDILGWEQRLYKHKDKVYCDGEAFLKEAASMDSLLTELDQLFGKLKNPSSEGAHKHNQYQKGLEQFIKDSLGTLGKIEVGSNDNVPTTCEGFIDEDLKAVLDTVLNIIRIAAPILLIILTAVDFAQAVISNDQDAVKKATSKVTKRIIAALALFFIPYIVELILNMPGISDWVSTDPGCNL